MSNEENLVLPEEINIGAAELAEMDKRPTLPDGVTAYFRIIEANKGEHAKNGHLYLMFRVVPLRDPSDAESGMGRYALNHRIFVPIVNENRPGHKKPNTLGFIKEFLIGALGPEVVPPKPGWNKAMRAPTWNGEIISEDEARDRLKTHYDALETAIANTWKNPTSMEGLCFVATKTTNDNGWPELRRIRAEPRDDEPLTDLSDF